ncbi:MAG: class I SAM-dependent methyltransferase [Elusimicrobia bacterium]|nr:class I SAM-dependent methyltransferase [Elusimicrobiota bacterium]
MFGLIWDFVRGAILRHYATSADVVRRSVRLRAADVVLDLGGGTGGVGALIRGAVRRAIVVEPDAALVRRGSERSEHIQFVRADGTRLPIRAASIDVMLIIEVLHHVEDADAVLRESARVLRPGGRILIEEAEFVGPLGHVRRWLEERISAGVWPRDRAGLRDRLAELGLRSCVLDDEGFVILAAREADVLAAERAA